DTEIAAATFTLSDAQRCIAREYGFASWPRLRAAVVDPASSEVLVDLIKDRRFRQAVDLVDEGDADRLAVHLSRYPQLARQREVFEGRNYFTSPSLLEFIAENPVREGVLSSAVLKVARVILDAGADADAMTATLTLVASGRVARECEVQVPLIDLLCSRGADAAAALQAAVAHKEVTAVHALLRHGAPLDLPTASALNQPSDIARLLPGTTETELSRGLALAAMYGHAEVARTLLDAGADPDHYNPPGAHAHSTPLHQAALEGHLGVIEALLACGARRDIKDIHHRATPADWARHAGQHAAAARLDGEPD
ncbi:MAG: ankyrin repeat domain-containing protein, partial [Pseudomonadota bacterium]